MKVTMYMSSPSILTKIFYKVVQYLSRKKCKLKLAFRLLKPIHDILTESTLRVNN
jgi:hypothetical protein